MSRKCAGASANFDGFGISDWLDGGQIRAASQIAITRALENAKELADAWIRARKPRAWSAEVIPLSKDECPQAQGEGDVTTLNGDGACVTTHFVKEGGGGYTWAEATVRVRATATGIGFGSAVLNVD